MAQGFATLPRIVHQTVQQDGPHATVLKVRQQGDIEQTDLCLVRTNPDSAGGLSVDHNQVVGSIRKALVVFAPLQLKLPADEHLLLPFLPLSLREFFFASAHIKSKQKRVISFGNSAQFQSATVRQSSSFTPIFHRSDNITRARKKPLGLNQVIDE